MSPPYDFTDIQILDGEFTHLGLRLRRALGLFWRFGPKAQEYISEDIADRRYRAANLPFSWEEFLDMQAQELKDFAEARN